jgi:hypothetical protein
MWRFTEPADLVAHVNIIERSLGTQSVGMTANGLIAQAEVVVNCCGSPNHWEAKTAIAPNFLSHCCYIAHFLKSVVSVHVCRRHDAID